MFYLECGSDLVTALQPNNINAPDDRLRGSVHAEGWQRLYAEFAKSFPVPFSVLVGGRNPDIAADFLPDFSQQPLNLGMADGGVFFFASFKAYEIVWLTFILGGALFSSMGVPYQNKRSKSHDDRPKADESAIKLSRKEK